MRSIIIALLAAIVWPLEALATHELSFKEWSAYQGLSPLQRTPAAIPAGDATPNGLKYLLGVAPMEAITSSQMPRLFIEELHGSRYWGMEISRYPAAYQATSELEVFRDLMHPDSTPVTAIMLEDQPEHWRAGIDSAEDNLLFARLRVNIDANPIPWYFRDLFDRDDTDPVSGEDVPDTIGPSWRAGALSGHWRISDAQLDLQSLEPQGQGILYSVDQPTTNAPGSDAFTLSGTIILNSGAPTGWAGLVVNFTEAGSGSMFRYNGEGRVQWVRANGSTSLDVPGAIAHTPGRPYRLSLFSPGPGIYDLNIIDKAEDTEVFHVLHLTDNEHETSTAGFGGFFANTDSARFDDFLLSLHAWSDSIAVDADSGWRINGGAFVSESGGLEALDGDFFWTTEGGDYSEGQWILTDRLFEPGILTVTYHVGDRQTECWNRAAGGMLWADTKKDGEWAPGRQIFPDRIHRTAPQEGWRQWTDIYRISPQTLSANGEPIIGNRIGFFLNTPLRENEQISFDRLRIDFTPETRKETRAVYDPVEPEDGWSVADDQFRDSIGGLDPVDGDYFWTVSGVSGNRQPAKLFETIFEPGLLTLSYQVGGLEGRSFPDHNAFLWADHDPAGSWAWAKRLMPVSQRRPTPQDGWLEWKDIYVITEKTQTAGGLPVNDAQIGFVFRALDLTQAHGVALDRLRITQVPFDRIMDPRIDPAFTEGFVLLDPDNSLGKVPVDRLDFGRGKTDPKWEVAQWWSNYSLEGALPQPLVPGGMGYTNQGTTIVLTPSGNEDAGLLLGVNSGVEFNFQPRDAGEPWPHLFVSQQLKQDESISLDQLTAVPFSAKARLTRYERFLPAQQSDHLHAAQYLVYFTVQNLNRASEDFGNYFWFGLRPYDNRYAFPPEYISPDTGSEYKPGTGKLIYNPAMAQFMDRSMNEGEWVSVQGDLFPFIQDGFTFARNRGYIHPDSRPEDFYIASLTLGWEVPGLFDVAIQLKDLEIQFLR